MVLEEGVVVAAFGGDFVTGLGFRFGKRGEAVAGEGAEGMAAGELAALGDGEAIGCLREGSEEVVGIDADAVEAVGPVAEAALEGAGIRTFLAAGGADAGELGAFASFGDGAFAAADSLGEVAVGHGAEELELGVGEVEGAAGLAGAEDVDFGHGFLVLGLLFSVGES